MFTYTLSGKTIENGQNRITVEYSNEAVKCTETFFFSSKEDLDNRIASKIKQLDTVIALDAELVTTNYKITEKPVEPIKEPTALTLEEIKQAEINTKKIELSNLVEQTKRDKEIALIASEDTDVALKLAELEALKSKL